MIQAKLGNKVKIDFTGTLENGEIFATTKHYEPLEITIGKGETFQKFEENIIGMQAGDTKKIIIEPDDGFGHRSNELIYQVKKTSLPKEIIPAIGEKLHIKMEDGKELDLYITEMDDTTVTLDANYPLAGKTLAFDVELLEIT